jgi:hypothetical protein
MSIENIKIAETEEVESKQGKKYFKIKDTQGNSYTCFEKGVIEVLKEAKNQGAEVEANIVEKNGFKNIRSVRKVEQKQPQNTQMQQGITTTLKDKNPAAMLTSYVKDLVIARLKPEMTDEQLRKVFNESVEMIKATYDFYIIRPDLLSK